MRGLLVATAGGHLTQLVSLAPRLGIDLDDSLWVTTDTAQSRSLLAERNVVWAPYGRPRDVGALARHAGLAARTVRRGRIDIAVSTGASLAPPFLAVARTAGVPSHFIESATRVTGPSFAGRLVSRIPGVHLYSQYRSWADRRWRYGGSVFDGWTVGAAERTALRRVLVTVGSARGFPFTQMIEAVRAVLPPEVSVIWQIGDADVTGLPGRVVPAVSAAEMQHLLAEADVVISHAGTGSVLACLEAGRIPVIIPRSATRGEHVDDHQDQIASMLTERGLALVRTPATLSAADLVEAASLRAERCPPPAFRLS